MPPTISAAVAVTPGSIHAQEPTTDSAATQRCTPTGAIIDSTKFTTVWVDILCKGGKPR